MTFLYRVAELEHRLLAAESAAMSAEHERDRALEQRDKATAALALAEHRLERNNAAWSDIYNRKVTQVEQQRDEAKATLEQFANVEHWLERADGRLVWIGPQRPDHLARAALAAVPATEGA